MRLEEKQAVEMLTDASCFDCAARLGNNIGSKSTVHSCNTDCR